MDSNKGDKNMISKETREFMKSVDKLCATAAMIQPIEEKEEKEIEIKERYSKAWYPWRVANPLKALYRWVTLRVFRGVRCLRYDYVLNQYRTDVKGDEK